MKIGNLEVYGIIYKITNIINGKVYIGQTIQDNGFNDRYDNKGIGIERVYNHYLNRKSRDREYNKHLFSSIEKYGLEAFEVIEIFDVAFSKEELDIKEILWIEIYNSINARYGYNNKTGGANGTHSEQVRQKISTTLKGKYGGKKCYWYGKKHSQESKNKQSKAKLGKYIGKYSPHATKVVCFTSTFEELFDTVKEGMEKYNVHDSNISKCCIGERNYCGIHPLTKERLIWCYEEDYNKLNKQQIKELIIKANSNMVGEFNPSAKKVVAITSKIIKIFNTVSEGTKYFNINNISNVSACCNYKVLSCGEFYGERIIWRYYDDYLKLTKEEIKQIIHKVKNTNSGIAKSIICIETECVYLSAREASKRMNISPQGINGNLRGRSNSIRGYHFKYISELTIEEYILYNIENKLKELNQQDLVQAV